MPGVYCCGDGISMTTLSSAMAPPFVNFTCTGTDGIPCYLDSTDHLRQLTASNWRMSLPAAAFPALPSALAESVVRTGTASALIIVEILSIACMCHSIHAAFRALVHWQIRDHSGLPCQTLTAFSNAGKPLWQECGKEDHQTPCNI